MRASTCAAASSDSRGSRASASVTTPAAVPSSSLSASAGCVCCTRNWTVACSPCPSRRPPTRRTSRSTTLDSRVRGGYKRDVLDAADSYYELGPKAQLPVDAQGLEADRPEPTSDRPGSEHDRPELTADRPELPPDLAAAVKALGTRPRQGPLRDVIASLRSWRPLKPAELGSILDIHADNLTKRHLTEMVAEGRLRRLFPGEPTHPNQAYAAASDDDEKSPT